MRKRNKGTEKRYKKIHKDTKCGIKGYFGLITLPIILKSISSLSITIGS